MFLLFGHLFENSWILRFLPCLYKICRYVSTDSLFGRLTCRVAVSLEKMSGRWYYECTLLSDGLMQIGWADSSFRCDPGCGQGVGVYRRYGCCVYRFEFLNRIRAKDKENDLV